MGLFFCYVGFWGKKEAKDSLLQEPLLNGSASNSRESNKSIKGDETVTPYANANIFSILTFSWMGPLLSLGYKKTLDLEDVPQLASFDSVRGSFPILNNKLESDSEGSNKVTTLMLAKGLIFTTWREISVSAVYVLVYTLASYVGPSLIETFVQYLNGKRAFENEGYVLVFVFFIAKVFECLSRRHRLFKVQQAGFRARAALVAKIYNKGLTLSCQSKQGHTSGEIINFMSVDAERIEDFSWYMHDPWMVILQVGLALAVLYKNLGLASLATLVATVVVMLANVPLGRLQEKFQDKLMKSKDKRMKATSEVLRNMRILKLQAWEMKFLSKVLELRNVETGWLKKYVYTSAITTFAFWGAPTFVSVVTFGACIVMGIPLESGKILSALATFRILQEPIYNLPDTISMIVQTKVSLDRIASFLSLDDLQPDVLERLPMGSSDLAIEIIDGNFGWDLSSPSPTLKDINLRVSHGMRIAICGTVGSGKSSLLSCILGEVPKISGTVRLSGRKSYVAQSPWIQSGKIEDNILFGKDMDRQRYERVLEACSLKKDLEILSFGDQTVIGERGINLSGGQKQRIQIARALYQDADIYLFDDPFSAVDAHTGTHLFNECILGLLDSKTVIYVTHQVEFLPVADLVLVMKDGRITQAGKYNDILKSGNDFMELVGAHKEALSALDSIEAGAAAVGEDSSTGNAKNSLQKKESPNDQNDKTDNAMGTNGQLIQEEEREKGRVGLSVYWKYITTAYGGLLVPFILLAQILFQLLQIGSNYWMAWATPVSKDAVPPVGGSTLITVYVALAIGSSFCIFARASLLVTAGYKTATMLFNKMHKCIFRAPMSFFDSTPSGRILNRASTDQSAVDLNIPSLVGQFAFSIIQLLGIIAVMSQVAWQVFIVFIPVISICIWLQNYYIQSARELARLVGVCKAPVIQHFSETLSGSSTIRSFDQESRFCDTSMKLIDGYSRPKFHTSGAMEWLCVRLDMLSLVTFAFSLIFLILIPKGTIDPSVAGLAVTYGLNLNMVQAWTVRYLCSMENRIISVERIIQYTSIPSEPPLVVESIRPESEWPSHGEISIQNLQVRYAPHMPLVLRGITCTYFGGKRTGIVGRTGSGKSTLIQTLFRIVEPTDGQILIDNTNILSIGLHDLRSRLSIIPQDPTMFEGTVRSNLDPLEEYTDEQIWEALDKCQLGDEVRKKEGKLDSAVSENGENWSVGQRQLVCLGRVLLKKSKILVLDEATASVDTATDNLIQQTLRQHFYDSTVITIAHRITSVLDSDMVLLLDHGLVKEYDTPKKLLEDKLSSFAKLVAEYSMRSSSSYENLEEI
ncbi:ABC transporter C family member 3 [Forsythia ovata]|uniref:ABC-type xenobiotic transporter n=1 Tax=Forsythia ovata TaxID=205694 RepID=A0ABD1S658_9LAMI